MTEPRSGWLIFTDRESFRTIDLFRLLYAAIAVSAFLLTEVGRNLYRPYVYENGINDFGIADSMGNLGGIVVQVFFSLAFLNWREEGLQRDWVLGLGTSSTSSRRSS